MKKLITTVIKSDIIPANNTHITMLAEPLPSLERRLLLEYLSMNWAKKAVGQQTKTASDTGFKVLWAQNPSFQNHNFSFCARQDWAGLVETLTRPPRLKDTTWQTI